MDSSRKERRRAICGSEKKAKISQNRGHKREKYSVRRARLRTESLRRNNQGNTLAAERGARAKSFYTNRLIHTVLTKVESIRRGITRANNLLQSSR